MNFIKLNTDKFHLIISKKRWIYIGKIRSRYILEENDFQLLGVAIDYNLRFDKHVSNICLKANRKLSALTRLANILLF